MVEVGACFVRREAQIGGADLDKIRPSPQTRQWHSWVRSSGGHQVDLLKQVFENAGSSPIWTRSRSRVGDLDDLEVGKRGVARRYRSADGHWKCFAPVTSGIFSIHPGMNDVEYARDVRLRIPEAKARMIGSGEFEI